MSGWVLLLSSPTALLTNKIEAPFTFDFMGEENTDYFHDREVGIGGALSLGYLVVDWLSVGAGVHIYHNTIWDYEGGTKYVWDTSVQVAGDLGFLIRRPDNSLVFDLHSIYTIQEEYYLDTVDEDTFEDNLPLIVEGTLTAAFLERRLFGVFKGLGDIYYGRRQGFVVRVIPVVEFWAWPFLSLRGGYQFTYLDIDNKSDMGHGFIAGVTLRLGKYDLDANFTSRYQPGRVLPGYGKRENFILIGLSRSNNFTGLSR